MKKILILFILMTPAYTGFSQATSLPGNFVHSVYFWLNNPDSETDRQEFLHALTTFIASSKYISSYHIAPAAGTPRDVVDNSFTYNLVCTFETKELQDLYQNEDVHLKFIEDASHLWERVQVYDSYPAISIPSSFSQPNIEVGVVVTDLQNSINFYTNVLGMVRTGEFTVNESLGKAAGLSNGYPLNVVVLKTSDSPAAPEWKLMSFENNVSPGPAEYIHDDIGMQYITLYPEDMDAVMERLKAAGIEFRGETPITLDDGRRFVLIQDPDGVFIELIGH
jgi:catechol 2,3-dioxygenase-like lactoylglutathione lyase family enzyme